MDRRLRVMVVDDEAIVCKRLKAALDKTGYDVETFDDPRQALACLDTEEFDLVVTDVRMGEVSGLDVLGRAQARSARTKVVMITGYATLEAAHEALAKGAFDFIAKPFKPNELRAVLDNAAKELKRSATEADAVKRRQPEPVG